MKRILITGSDSYIGTSVEKWLLKEPDKFHVETLDMKNPNWKVFDFSNFDVVFHVAGIAHVSTKKSMKDLYLKVNRDLAIETAIKSKESGVKQFIFMSSMIVYSSKETLITKDTIPNPDNFYGLSKIQAEEGIIPLQSKTFDVVIMRPPMIYGKNSKGNFKKLMSISKYLRIIPNYTNKRSVLYIGNFCIFIKSVIERQLKGVFLPQNSQYTSTNELIITILQLRNKKFVTTNIFNPVIKFLCYKNNYVRKIFGDHYYERDETPIEILLDFENSIKESITNEK